MVKLADILFVFGAGIIVLYFITIIINPNIFKNRGPKLWRLIVLVPLLSIIISFILYYVKSKTITNQKYLKTTERLNLNLDSLKKISNSDTITFSKIDKIINEIQRNKEELNRINDENQELQKRIGIDNFNQSISDSILNQIQLYLKKVEIKSNYSNVTKTIVSGGKRVVYQGKTLVINEKVYNDIYIIGSFNLFPILKQIDFSKDLKSQPINYYIDSVQINFKVIKNNLKAKNTGIDSLIYIAIHPEKTNYKYYKQFISFNNEKIKYIKIINFNENASNSLVLDFPNTSNNDSTVCFDFYLRRGLIGSYCISFK